MPIEWVVTALGGLIILLGVLAVLAIPLIAAFYGVMEPLWLRRFARGLAAKGELLDDWHPLPLEKTRRLRAQRAGNEIELTLRSSTYKTYRGRTNESTTIVWRAHVREALFGFAITPAPTTRRLQRLFGGAEHLVDGRYVLEHGSLPAEDERGELLPALATVFDAGYTRLAFVDDRLTIEKSPIKEGDLTPSRLSAVYEALCTLAVLCSRRRLAGPELRFAWTGGGEQHLCPFCRDSLQDGPESVPCPSCKTLHHDECLQEAGGCSIFACSGAATRRQRRGTEKA
jgi:hypothetical protein